MFGCKTLLCVREENGRQERELLSHTEFRILVKLRNGHEYSLQEPIFAL
jgi:hypothetical protein